MKKRFISVFVFALAVSGGAAFVLYQLISSRVTAGAASHPTTVSVFVAARDLEPGVMVADKDIVTQQYVSVPAGAVVKKEDIINRGVINAIHRDTPFFEGTLAAAGAGGGFANTIPKGMRALAVRVNEVVGLAGFAVAGMHVDVLVAGTPPGHQNGAISRTLLQNISVLSAGQNYQKDIEGKPVMVQVVNLLVTPDQAEVLNLAVNERIQLVLRNPTDLDVTKTPGAATANLFDGPVIRSAGLGSSDGTTTTTTTRRVPRKPAAPPMMAGVSGAPGASGAPMAPPPPPKPATIEVLSGGSRVDIVIQRPLQNPASGTAK